MSASASALQNKIAIVTGANGGIGYQVAVNLAGKNTKVILACRDPIRATAAIERIKAQYPQADLEFAPLDLSNLSSVRAFVAEQSAKRKNIDLLINNAAIMALPERKLSPDGFEIQFATNHLGHFALTNWLMPLLTNSAAPRVVTVSSIAHRYGNIDFNNLQGEQAYEGWKAYGNSKLANLLFSFELARRAQNLTSIAAHPGVAKTNILQNGPQQGKKVLRTYVSEILTMLLAQSDAQGALPILYAALDPQAKNGAFYGPDGFKQIRGKPILVTPSLKAKDLQTAEKLWSVCESMIQGK